MGGPLFCSKCGRSYGVRFCPKLHRNAVTASACSECGSKELSQPQQAATILARGVAVLGMVLGLVLLAGTLFYLVQFARRLLSDPSSTLPAMMIGLAIGLVWLLFVSGSGRAGRR